MRLANHEHRATLVVGPPCAERGLDVARLSGDRFGSDPAALYPRWDEFTAWAANLDPAAATADAIPLERTRLGPPSPWPRQVFAIGLNYRSHAEESGFDAPTGLPPVFTKYPSSFTGPDTTVPLPSGGNVDWEIELVVVIGRGGHGITVDAAWSHVAGLTAGQDLSERLTQLRGPAPQFGLGKSFPGFSPQGPWLVTPDEFADPDDLELGCVLDGEQVQKGRTRDLIFPVPALISALSDTVTLQPGDVVFTGTPAGVGVGRRPQRFIQPGQRLRGWVEGIGELHQVFQDATDQH
ncbi:fumarylacetoacetate hydrolase family protein [Amycolatopsis sp. cmx-11-51]|uniref:fumarylacetoacetate hydrolase family protein n=1 Tax=unclassified Amycolatopsis TaxID=2618356 RepID=UPI0039E6F9DE